MTEKLGYLPHFWLDEGFKGSDEGFKGTVVNRELPFLHIEITLTVPLIYFIEGETSAICGFCKKSVIFLNAWNGFKHRKDTKVVQTRGVFRNLFRAGLKFFSFQGAQHPLGHENPLKSIDFTGPEGGLSPHSPPPWIRLWCRLQAIDSFSPLSFFTNTLFRLE